LKCRNFYDIEFVIFHSWYKFLFLFARFAALHSRKDIKFLSLVQDRPVFPKNVYKNLLLKFILNRNNLNKIYVTYVLPLLEYACELWDGCCSRDADKLEQLQFEAWHLGTLYCKEFLRFLMLTTKYSFRQSCKYSGAILLCILWNKVSFRRIRLQLIVSQPVSKYKDSLLANFGNPVIILALQIEAVPTSFRNIFQIVFSVYYTFMEFIGSEF
jgi:hypothetical protein